MKNEELMVELKRLRFNQGYVRRPVVEAKQWIEHLQLKWGSGWRDHIQEVRGISSEVMRQLSFADITLPIRVAKQHEIYIVQNGTHTCYSYWERNIPQIRALIVSDISSREHPRTYSFEEIEVQSD